MNTLTEILEQVVNDCWNDNQDTWEAKQDIKEVFKTAVDGLELPVKVKALLKKTIEELE